MGKLGGWISDRVNDCAMVRYLALPLVLLYLVPLLCAASVLQGWSVQKRRTESGPKRNSEVVDG